MFPGNPGHGEVQDAVSGPRSAARPRGQGVWAGLVHPASPGSAKGPTHRAHHDRDQWPWGARGAGTEERQSEACGVPGIRRPGAGVPDPVHTQCGKVAGLRRPLGCIHSTPKPWGQGLPLRAGGAGKTLGLGLACGGALAASSVPCVAFQRGHSSGFFFFVVLALVYFYFPGI